MRKTHEVLRLHFDLKLSWLSVKWTSEAELEAALFSADPKPPRAPARNLPDFSHIHKELQEHKHVTLQLLWEEYGATHPDGYRYSEFCHHYQQWKRQRDVVMRQQHRPGEKLFVDWAGDKISVHEPDRGAVLQASLFVAVLGASSYTYAEATADETMPNWIGAHVRAFEFMGGVAELLIPDNTKTGVSKACRYEPDLTQPIRRWPCTTAWGCCRLGRENHGIRQKWRPGFFWPSAGY
jgi:transposase